MAEVVIVGAGIIGSAIALELSQRSVQPLLLERSIPGAESSSAAAGMLAPQLEAHAPDPVFELGLFSRALYPEWVQLIEAASGLPMAYEQEGAIQLFERPEASAAALERLSWQRAQGLRIEPLSRAALKAQLPGLSERFGGGLYFPQEAQIDPRRLMRALSLACAKAGAEHRACTVRRILVEAGSVCGVELEEGRLMAKRVVIAAGAWSSRISGAPLPEGSVGPARGQMLALDLGRPRFAPYLWAPGAYLVPRRDGRLLVGATVERAGFSKQNTAGGLHKLLDEALKVFPDLFETPVLETWSGLRPWTPDERPIFGETRIRGLYVATGHYRNGILQAPATAKLLTEQLLGLPSSLGPEIVQAFGAQRATLR